MSGYDWVEDDSLSPEEVRARFDQLEPDSVVTGTGLGAHAVSVEFATVARTRTQSAGKRKSAHLEAQGHDYITDRTSTLALG